MKRLPLFLLLLLPSFLIAQQSNDILKDLQYLTTWDQANSTMYKYNGATYQAKILTFTGTTTSGAVTFYMTDTALSGGTAVYTNVYHVNPIVNNAGTIYNYAWTVSPDKKTLTVNVKQSSNTATIALLGISLLSSLTDATNGTTVNVVTIGN